VVPGYAGGNPDLQPETSTQRSVGLVWQATAGMAVGVDYWNIRLDGMIAPLEAANALKYHAQFSDRILRGPIDPAYPDLPGPIVGLNLSPINLGTTKTSGLDAFFNWSAPTQAWGQLRAGLQGTYVARYDTQIDGVQYVSIVGSAVVSPPIPRWRSALTVDWNLGAWGSTVSQLYSSSYTDQFPGPDGAPRKVGPTLSTDLQVRYAGLAAWNWAVGIRNLFDRDPPASNQGRSAQVGYNPQLSSPLGRAYYLRGVWTFK
jgi:iron complex outermembrane receptor protein